MGLNFSDDWKYWDNLESVAIVTGIRGPAESTNWPATAKRLELAYRELVASNGAYVSQDRKWLVPTQFLPGDIPPALGDTLTDSAGTVWTVISADLNTWGTWWSLACRNLVLVSGLSDTAALWRPTNNQDLAGGRLPGYAVVSGAEALRVRIQETGGTVEDRLGKKQAVRRFTCFCGSRIYPEARDRIIASDGTIYQITSWGNADRVDLLMEITLEIVQ